MNKYITILPSCIYLLVLVSGCMVQRILPSEDLNHSERSRSTITSETVQVKNTPTVVVAKETISSKPDDLQDWQQYVNSRYDFTISFPPSWPRGEESENGDGIQLYIGNPDIDIRVYAAHIIEGISEPYSNANRPGFRQQRIQLNNGRGADLIIGRETSIVHYEMVVVSNDIEYHFYARVTEEFYKQNEQTLLETAKGFDFW